MTAIKKEVVEANKKLPKANLVKFTWGNASFYDRSTGKIYIKPSGVEYDDLTINDIIVLNIDGELIEGNLRPSSDTPTHLELYRAFDDVNAIVHTHSPWATAFAQSGEPIPAFGTTHADYFDGLIPITRQLAMRDTVENYEANTGKVIVDTMNGGGHKPLEIPACLVYSHGPFVWSDTLSGAVHNAIVLEDVACIAYHTLMLNRKTPAIPNFLVEKHFKRKHGPSAYYGN